MGANAKSRRATVADSVSRAPGADELDRNKSIQAHLPRLKDHD
jgi:hypothetical protein